MNNNAACLGSRVARTAKGYQVAQFVCLFVIVIFALDVAELPEWLYMVHIQCLANLFAGYAAILACVVIPLARPAPLPAPVWSIVNKRSPAPQRGVFAAQPLRLPIGFALCIAEMMATLFFPHLRGNAHKGFAAIVAWLTDRLGPPWITRTPHVLGHVSLEAGSAAKVMFVASVLGWTKASKSAATLIAGNLGIISPTRMVHPPGVIALPFPVTGSMTEVILRLEKAIGVALQCFSAIGTFDCNHLSLQKNTPQRVAQKCYLMSCARAYKVNYISQKLLSNHSSGSTYILPQRREVGY